MFLLQPTETYKPYLMRTMQLYSKIDCSYSPIGWHPEKSPVGCSCASHVSEL